MTLSRTFLAASCALVALEAGALDVAGIDRSIDPCTDFYQYANRRWLETHPIPQDRPRWGAMDEIDQRSEQLLRATVDEALAAPLPPEGSARRKVLQFFASGLDVAAIERAGLE